MSRSTSHDERNKAFAQAFHSADAAIALSKPTAQTIKARAKILGYPWRVEHVPNSESAKIHWLGKRSSRRVILYFHGGGYGLGASDGHVIFLAQCVEKLAATGQDVAIAFLEYGLTTGSKYPTQLVQATESLRYLIENGYKPSDIVVGGDSAGGNLAIALMSNILHPLPGSKDFSLDCPMAGLLLISPWVTFSSDALSFKECEHQDIVAVAAVQEWADRFASAEERNIYTEPLRAEASWWSNLPAKKVLNLAGGHEVFRDDIVAFGKRLETANVHVKTVVCPKQVHVDCILDAETGLDVGPMSTETWSWLNSVY